MKFIIPKNSEKFCWTNHAVSKMIYYQLSQARIKRVLNNPKRKELGIAPNTIAVMQPNSSKHSYEIWAMYQVINPKSKAQISKPKKIKVITAWKYPGKSPINGPVPIPMEILEELGGVIN